MILFDFTPSQPISLHDMAIYSIDKRSEYYSSNWADVAVILRVCCADGDFLIVHQKQEHPIGSQNLDWEIK